MAKRGRPPKDPFVKLAQSRLNASNSRNLASALYKKLGAGDTDINQELINGYKELIADYRKHLGAGKFISDEIILLYSEIGGEHLTPQENALLNTLYEAKLAEGKAHQARGTEGGKNKVNAKAQAVWGMDGKNKDLLRRIEKGSLSLNGAITKILSDWEMRGDEEVKSPSARTLSNWYYMLYPKK